MTRLLSLDYDPVFGDATRTTFASDASVFDFDVVIWNPAATLQWYVGWSSQTYQGLPSLSDDRSVQLLSDIKRRNKEFLEFVEAGRSLVVVVRPPQECYVATGEKSFSGTGKNRQTTRHVTSVDLLHALPTAAPKFTRASGERIAIVGDGELQRLLRQYKSFLGYAATMDEPPGTVLATVAGTDRAVSSVLRSKKNGQLFLMPSIRILPVADESEDGDDEVETWPEEAVAFQDALIDALLLSTTVVHRPAWASDYTTAAQRDLRREAVKQQERVETARRKLSALQQKVEVAEARDQLFLGTGRALEMEVKAVLELLGGVVEAPDDLGRDDWRVQFPEVSAVVEVKGVLKSGAEKNAAQLEKWVAGAYEESGAMPKAILVVNTWRDTPLAERTKADFPDQMLPYSKTRNHCLLTGLDLFVIRAEVEADPDRADYWRKKIIDTAGRLEGVPNWRTVIEQAVPEA